MRKLLWQLLAVFMVMSVTVGCSSDSDSDGSGGGGSEDYTEQVRSLDLSGAQGLYITGDNLDAAQASALRSGAYSAKEIQRAASQVDLDPNSIYKVTEDGTLVRVEITDDSGAELPRGSVQPLALQDINAQYLIIWLKVTARVGDEIKGKPYLVHKSTGLAYNASSLIYDATLTEYETGGKVLDVFYADIQGDEHNNLYIRTDISGRATGELNPDQTVYKIDLSDLGGKAITATEIPSAYSIGDDWIVDKDGKFIAFGIRSESTEPTRYLAIETGRIYNLNDSIDEIFHAEWVLGMDNNIYSFVTVDVFSDSYKLYRISANQDGSPHVVKVADTNSTIGSPWLLSEKNRYVIGGRLFYIGNWNEGTAFVIEDVDVVNARVYDTSLDDIFSTVEEFVVSNSRIYCFGKFKDNLAHGLYAYDPIARTGEKVVIDADYDVQKFKLMASGDFLVEGIRLTDQAHFYGTLRADGTVTVTSTVAIGAPTIIMMEAIRPADFMLIDGSPSEWATSLRVLTDNSSDGAADGDLLYYSETTSSSQYFGMVEHAAGLNESYFVEVTFMGDETLLFSDDNTTFNNNVDGNVSLSQANGAAARGEVIEFLMPLNILSTPNVKSVTLYGHDSNGDINTSDIIDVMN